MSKGSNSRIIYIRDSNRIHEETDVHIVHDTPEDTSDDVTDPEDLSDPSRLEVLLAHPVVLSTRKARRFRAI